MNNYSKISGKKRRTGNRMNLAFRDRVCSVVAKIPRGKVMSYQEVARRAGSPRAARAVGNIMNKNRDSKVFCHRVVRSDGSVGGFAFGTEKKKKKLKSDEQILQQSFQQTFLKYDKGYSKFRKSSSSASFAKRADETYERIRIWGGI